MGVPYAEVIGDPVAHSRSPLIHKFWLEKLGIEGDYRPARVVSEELAPFVNERLADPDWRGCNLTIPHKAAAARIARESVAPVARLQAANCLVRHARFEPYVVAHNSDVSGFVEPLGEFDFQRTQWLFAHVIGTGGAAAAATYALHDLGFTVFNYGRTRQKAEALRRRLGEKDMDFARDWAELAGVGLVCDETEESVIELLVNATPMGMDGFPPLDIALAEWGRHTIVYDLVYAPLETPLLAAARQRAMRTIDGLHMLIGQAAVAFELFFEAPAPREHDSELRELLVR